MKASTVRCGRASQRPNVRPEKFEFGLYDAIANFNIGRKATIQIYEKLGLNPGRFTTAGFSNLTRKRLFQGAYKSSLGIFYCDNFIYLDC